MPSPSASPAADSLTKRAVVGTGWSAAANAGRQVLSLVFVGVLGRLLGPSTYGLVGMAGLITNFLLNFRDLGTGAAIIQRPQVSQRFLSTVFWANIFVGLAFWLVTIAISQPAAWFFQEPRVAPLLTVMAISFPLTALGIVPEFVMRRESRFRNVAIADITGAVASYAVGLSCAFQGLGAWSLVLANLAGSFVSTTCNFVFSGWRPQLVMDWGELRSIASFSLNLSGFTLVNYFARNADNLIVGRMLGAGPLGQYQMAYNLMMFPIQNISSVIAQAQYPSFARIQHDDARLGAAWLRSCQFISLVTFPIMAGLAVVADPFVRVLLGSKWLDVIWLFRILAPVGLLQSVVTLVGLIYNTKARTATMFRMGLLNTVWVITAFVTGIRWGIVGVATAYLIAVVLMLPLSFAVPLRIVGLNLRSLARALAPQLLIALGMTTVAVLVMLTVSSTPPLVQLVATSVAGALAYYVLLRVFRPAVLHDLVSVLDSSVPPRIARAVRVSLGF